MIKLTKELKDKYDALSEKRKCDILDCKDDLKIEGTAYYVSADGDDLNDGKTPESAWKTLERVNGSYLISGDGIFFRRGDLYRGEIYARPGVTYGAYGEGDKPKFYGWDEDLADPLLWNEVDAKHHIWKYTKKILDVGTLVFNKGAAHSRKLIPTYKNLEFVCREDENKIFDMKTEMSEDLDIFWRFDGLLTREEWRGENFPVPCTGNNCYGDLYLRCDGGNPGDIFESIEAIVFRCAFRVGKSSNVRIDNICMKYFCFGVTASGHSVGLHVTNCEIGWIGGNIQHYYGIDPNFPQGRRGTVTRFGNGVEIYGGCEDYTVSNCYVYQVYDAAMTHQVSTGKKVVMKNIRYTDNLIERCVYGIEYFLDQAKGERESLMEDVIMSGNIIRLSGYGWGQQRHNKDTPAHIKSWSYTNTARNYVIKDNVFDQSAYRMLHLVAEKEEFCPMLSDNTYIQHLGGMLGQYGAKETREPDSLIFDEDSDEKIMSVFGDKSAKVYYVEG
ncbi:MAG: hypothetical protein E7635_07720 [Ruminococcaceae bacterium]|nr:hypothetical protein [Oscillospiraceae bacterium]